MLYHSLNFDVSQESKDWILNRYDDKLSQHVWHDYDISQYLENRQKEWHASILGKEINEFLSTYKLNTSYFGISAFVSNANEYYLGNPHVDSKLDKNLNLFRIKTRFNVMILGNPKDPMIWWDSIDYDDSRLTTEEYNYWDNQYFKYTKSIPGKTKEERLQFVGQTNLVVENVLTPSAFIKTDCAHTVNVSPGPRLILSVALDKSIEEILSLNSI